MLEAKSFDCPNCGSALDYQGGDEDIIQCDYCDSSIIVPKELRNHDELFQGKFQNLDWLTNNADEMADLGRLVGTGRKIEAIKQYRQIFGVGLKETKDAVDKMMRGESIVVTHSSVETSSPTPTGWTFPEVGEVDFSGIKELAKLVHANKKIEAIELYRQLYGTSLKEAKEAVEKMMRGESVTVSRTTTVETSSPTTSWTVTRKGTAKFSEFKEFAELVKANKKIEAIKLYQQLYGVGLKEAKEAVEKIKRG